MHSISSRSTSVKHCPLSTVVPSSFTCPCRPQTPTPRDPLSRMLSICSAHGRATLHRAPHGERLGRQGLSGDSREVLVRRLGELRAIPGGMPGVRWRRRSVIGSVPCERAGGFAGGWSSSDVLRYGRRGFTGLVPMCGGVVASTGVLQLPARYSRWRRR